MSVLIYDGQGAVPHSVLGLAACAESYLRLTGATDAAFLRRVSGEDLDREETFAGARFFLMPGGPSTLFRGALHPGNRASHLRRFVEAGGIYFGVCGGAYLACGAVAFDEGGLYERRVRDAILNFFPKTCRGPIFPDFSATGPVGVHAVPMRLCGAPPPATVVSYYHGGGYFDGTESCGDAVQVLAGYDLEKNDGRAAIVRCRVGNGLAILCGPHLEYAPSVAEEQLAQCRAERSSYDWSVVGNCGGGEPSPVELELEKIVAAGTAGQELLVHMLCDPAGPIFDGGSATQNF